jgi:hypothetical protein
MSLTAVAISVCVTLAATTHIRCPNGGWLFGKAGTWTVSVEPIPTRDAHNGRGDVGLCRCRLCERTHRGGVWYRILSYVRAS